MRYLLLLLVCLAGCGSDEPDQSVISSTAVKTFTASVMAVARDQKPKAIAVVLLANGGLYTLVEPFDKFTDTKLNLEPGQEIAVEYVSKYKTDFKDGELQATYVASPGFEIKTVKHVPLVPITKYEDLFKDSLLK